MSEGSKTTREHIPARSDVSQRVRTPATRPGTITKIPYQALQVCGGTCCIENDATFLTHLLATLYDVQFFAWGTAEQALLRVGHPSLNVDHSLQIDLT